MKLNFSADLAILISLITVFLFANGQAYIAGYLEPFNIDSIMLSFTVQDKIYMGYLYGFKYLFYGTLIAIGLMVIRYICISIDLKRASIYLISKIIRVEPIKHTAKIHNDSFHEELENSYTSHSILGITVITLLITSLYLIAHTEKKAKFEAIERIKAFDFEQVELRNTKSSKELYIVLCGSNLCSLINREKKIILEDPKNLAFSIKGEKH